MDAILSNWSASGEHQQSYSIGGHPRGLPVGWGFAHAHGADMHHLMCEEGRRWRKQQ